MSLLREVVMTGTVASSDLRELLEHIGLAGLLPEAYAVYRPIITGAFVHFLERLSAVRVEEILVRQAGLPGDAGPARRATSLMRLCPSLHKLGQVIARHRSLDAEFRRWLQTLESMASASTMSDWQPLIEAEIGPAIEPYRITPAPGACSEASVAVVIPITWSPSGGETRDGVLKVLKPGVADRLGEELQALGKVADYLDERRLEYGLPNFGYRESFETVRNLLTHEVHFEHEQNHLAAAAEFYAGSADVCIPALLPFRTPRVTAMQRIAGCKVTDHGGAGYRRRALAHTVVRALLADVVLSRNAQVMFHADPHAGNLFATQDDRLAVLDWSLAGRLSKDQRVGIAQVVAGAMTLDASRIARAIADLATSPPPAGALQKCTDAALHRIGRERLPGPTWVMGLLDSLAAAGTRFPADLMLLRKSMLTLEGVVADVCADCSLDGALVASTMQVFLSELPRRLLARFDSRDFGTHLSNFDLAAITACAPASLTSFWMKSGAGHFARREVGSR